MKQTFEEYLEQVCFEINKGILDDAMPDFFNNWLEKLDGEDYMQWANLYARKCYIEGKEEVLEKLS